MMDYCDYPDFDGNTNIKMFRKIIAAYCGNHTTSIDALFGQYTEFLIVYIVATVL
jgi:hypothetical protein